jgi:hypothetical protein
MWLKLRVQRLSQDREFPQALQLCLFDPFLSRDDFENFKTASPRRKPTAGLIYLRAYRDISKPSKHGINEYGLSQRNRHLHLAVEARGARCKRGLHDNKLRDCQRCGRSLKPTARWLKLTASSLHRTKKAANLQQHRANNNERSPKHRMALRKHPRRHAHPLNLPPGKSPRPRKLVQ